MTHQTWRVPFLDLQALHTDLQPELDQVWHDVVTETAFIAGQHATRFEQAWAEYCGVANAVGTANGTDSIELILLALGIGPGDEVIIPANTFIATAEAAVACGATPIFVDVDPDTLLVTAQDISPAISPRTAAIIPVHLYGQPCQMDAILRLAQSHGLAVIEDAAQAHGARWKGTPVGALGTAASFSFYPGKNLGAFGDAGAVVTDDDELAARIRSLANHGRADGQHVVHPLMGRNSRLDGLQAGVLTAKLAHLDKWNEGRRTAHQRYMSRLSSLPQVVPVVEHPDAFSVWHLNVVQVPRRDQVVELMHARGVDVRIHYPTPCHQHPSIEAAPSLPNVEASTPRLLSLPMYPSISDEEIDLVCTTLDQVVEEVLAVAGDASVG